MLALVEFAARLHLSCRFTLNPVARLADGGPLAVLVRPHTHRDRPVVVTITGTLDFHVRERRR